MLQCVLLLCSQCSDCTTSDSSHQDTFCAFVKSLCVADAAMMLPDFYGLSERTVQDLSAKPLSPVDKETLPFVPSLLPYVSQAGAEERSLPQTVGETYILFPVGQPLMPRMP